MSGPIVRKYGFPNHDAIFGKKELEHGVDEADAGGAGAAEPSKGAKPKRAAATKRVSKKKSTDSE